jgi:hypothetical protein
MSTPAIDNARRKLKIEDVRIALTHAISSRNQTQLRDALTHSANIRALQQLDKEARNVLVKVEEEDATVAAIDLAISQRNLSTLQSAIERAAALGLSEDQRVAHGRTTLRNFEDEDQCDKRIKDAVDANTVEALQTALRAAEKLEWRSENVDKAQSALNKLKTQCTAREQIMEATRNRDLEKLDSVLTAVKGLLLDESDEAVLMAHKEMDLIRQERALLLDVAQAIQSREVEALRDCTKRAKDLGFNTDAIRTCESTLKHVEAEIDAVKHLRAAIEAKNLSALAVVLKQAEELGVHKSQADSATLVEQGAALKAVLVREAECRSAMESAVKARNPAALEAATTHAQSLNISPPENVATMLAQFTCEFEAKGAIRTAAQRYDRDELLRTLAVAESLGVTDGEEVTEGKRVLHEMDEKAKVATALRAGTHARSLIDLETTLTRAAELGMSENDDVKAANELVAVLQHESQAMEALKAACSTKDKLAIATALDVCIELNISHRFVCLIRGMCTIIFLYHLARSFYFCAL